MYRYSSIVPLSFSLTRCQLQQLNVTLLDTELKPGSASHHGKLWGMFTAAEVRHHLFEGALGPEYGFSDTSKRNQPQYLSLDVCVDHVRRETLLPLNESHELYQLLDRAQPHSGARAGDSTCEHQKDVWRFERDVFKGELCGPWVLANINNVISC